MREFSAAVTIQCAPERAFDFVADHRNVRRVLEGITRWDPVQPGAEGRPGARYEVEMRTLGIPLSNRLELDRWERPRRISWHSVSGLIEQRGGWTFAPAGSGTRVTLRIAYQPPGAGLGDFLAGRADAVVRRRLVRALEAMRGLLEEPGG